MRYRLLIVAATLIWGSSFIIVKDTTAVMSPAWILVVRFLMATVILAAVFVKKRDLYFKKEYIGYGCLFGAAMFMAYYLQTIGITDTTPGKNAFLTGTYCVMVPFVAWAMLRVRPNRFNIVAAVLCLAGIGLVSLDGGLSMSFGDAMTLACAVFYALHIALVAKFAPGRDIFVLTMWQFAMITVLSFAAGMLFEPMPRWGELGLPVWGALAYLGVACSAVALLFQNIGQKFLPPSNAALLLSLESPFGVFFSVVFGYEMLTGRVLLGFAVIFAAILVSEVLPGKMNKQEN